jgi:16S rRNA (cytosine1402-N4)-methyltransferase
MSGHVPVLMNEVVDALQPRDGGRYDDGTFGGGGYTSAIHDRAACEVIAIDRDPDAIAAGKALAERYAPRLRLIEGRFGEMEHLLSTAGVSAVDGVALDLGVSSMQFDRAERGFSFRNSGPLDMRMAKSGASAADLVNGSDESDPATRAFQALRIAVNDELGELERGLAAAEQVLAPGGRLAVVSFHSLEDRAVKEFVRVRSGRTPAPSRHAPPRAEERAATLRDLTRKPVPPSDAEVSANPRARSARLRVAEKVRGAA